MLYCHVRNIAFLIDFIKKLLYYPINNKINARGDTIIT